MDRAQVFAFISQKATSASFAGLDFALPTIVERKGVADTGLGENVTLTGDTSLSPEERKIVQTVVDELKQQEDAHVELAEACTRVLEVFESTFASMDDGAGRAQLADDNGEGFGESERSGSKKKKEAESAPEKDLYDDDERDDAEILLLHGNTRRRDRSRQSNAALPKDCVQVLKEWLYSHVDHPYPSQSDKEMMSVQTGLSLKQINNWFINARRRHLAEGGGKRTKRDPQPDVW